VAQITIEIPDELLPRLEPHQNRLSSVLSRWVATLDTTPDSKKFASSQATGVYQEIIDFLLTRPDPTTILSFKISEQSQTRLSQLLEQNRTAQPAAKDVVELDLYEQLDQMMRMLKIRVFAGSKFNGEGSPVQAG